MPLKILFLSMENIRMVTTPSQSHPQTFWYIRKQKKPMQSTSRTLLFRGLKLWELIRPIFSVFSCNYCVCSVAQSCLTFCDPMDYSLPGSSVHGILQARILEWVTVYSSRGSSCLRDRTCVSRVSCIAGSLYHLSHQRSLDQLLFRSFKERGLKYDLAVYGHFFPCNRHRSGCEKTRFGNIISTI